MYGDLTDLIVDGIRELGFDPDDIRYVVVSMGTTIMPVAPNACRMNLAQWC